MNQAIIRFALPKGRMQPAVEQLLAEAGLRIRAGARNYRPTLSEPGYEVKLLKPQNVVEMLGAGSRDLGFAGADWVLEKGVALEELLDTGLDTVRIVAAAPSTLLQEGRLPNRRLVVASEYARLCQDWIERRDLDAEVLRTYGATEVFPPEDADVIVDNTATGSTLAANDLEVVEELMTSSTRLYASPAALANPALRERIDDLVLLLGSVLAARGRVMVEVNVGKAELEAVIAALPCMREPTIAQLHGDAGYAVKAAVPRADLTRIVPALKSCGGTDIVVSSLDQIVP